MMLMEMENVGFDLCIKWRRVYHQHNEFPSKQVGEKIHSIDYNGILLSYKLYNIIM